MKVLKTLLNAKFVTKTVDDDDDKITDHITGIYRGSAHWYCNMKVELNHKTPIVSYNLKNYDSHVIMLEIGKFVLKVNFIPNGL